MHAGSLLPYSQLSQRFHLPDWMGFHFFQLQHAFRAQFPQPPSLQANPIRELLTPEDLEKPFSTLYTALLMVDSPKVEKLFEYWQKDIPSLDGEDWGDCLEQVPKLVISSKDNLIQVKFLHRVYYTPARLHRIFPDRDPVCHSCKVRPGSYLHMFW